MKSYEINFDPKHTERSNILLCLVHISEQLSELSEIIDDRESVKKNRPHFCHCEKPQAVESGFCSICGGLYNI